MTRPLNQHPKKCRCRLHELEAADKRRSEQEASRALRELKAASRRAKTNHESRLGCFGRGRAMQMDGDGFFWVWEGGVLVC